MEPSVKFVSRINGSFSKEGVGQFFIRKNPKPGGEGSREVWQITRLFM